MGRYRCPRAVWCVVLLMATACVDRGSAATAPARPPGFAAALQDTRRPAVDYRQSDRWGCAWFRADDLCRRTLALRVVDPDGRTATSSLRPATDPPVDCFYVYPTVDLDLRPGNHDDLNDVARAQAAIAAQAAPFAAACRVYAPFYRQATLGSYSATTETAAPIFQAALADVAGAFEHYLEHWNDGRPLVLMGHSQGAQLVSYLLHVYFDGAAEVTTTVHSRTALDLRRRLVVALPIGFNVYTPRDADRGGSFADVPVCMRDTQTGCAIHYRSHPEGRTVRSATAAGARTDGFLAGRGWLNRPFDPARDTVRCVNPATTPVAAGATVLDATLRPVDAGDTRVLARTVLLGMLGDEPTAYRARFAATCRPDRDGGQVLAIGHHRPAAVPELGTDPIPLDGVAARSRLGLHLWDMSLAMGDLVAQVRQRTAAWQAAH